MFYPDGKDEIVQERNVSDFPRNLQMSLLYNKDNPSAYKLIQKNDLKKFCSGWISRSHIDAGRCGPADNQQ